MSAYYQAGIGYVLGVAVFALLAAIAIARFTASARPVPRWGAAGILVVWIALAGVLVSSGGRWSRIAAILSEQPPRRPSPLVEPMEVGIRATVRQFPTDPTSVSMPTNQLVVPELVDDFLAGGDTWSQAGSSLLVDTALATLAMLPDPEKTLSFEANGASYWKVRLAAERLLWFGAPEATDQLRASLDHAQPNVRTAAALTLALLGDHGALPQLVDRLSRETVSPVQCAIAEAILQLSGTEDEEAVETLANSLTEETPRRLLIAATRRDPGAVHRSENAPGLWNCPTQPELWRPVAPSDTLADLQVCDLDGQPIRLSEAASIGRLMISFVTGDHCYMCDTFLNSVLLPEADRASASQITLLVLPYLPRRAREYANQFGLVRPDAAIRVIADPQAELAARLGIARQHVLHSQWCNPPAAFLLDRELTVRFRHVGKSVVDRVTVFP